MKQTPGSEVVVVMKGCSIDGRRGRWTGCTQPYLNRGRWGLPEVWEIAFSTGDLGTLWLPAVNLEWV